MHGGYYSRVVWRPYAEPRSRRDSRSNIGLDDRYPRRDSEGPCSHTQPNHCRQGSSSGGGCAHNHSNSYTDVGANQTADTGAHGRSNGYADVGANQTANTGAHSHSNSYTDVDANQTANTGAHSHSNGYTDVGADQTANTGAHGHSNGPIPSPRLHERSLAGTTSPSVGFRDQELGLGTRWYRW